VGEVLQNMRGRYGVDGFIRVIKGIDLASQLAVHPDMTRSRFCSAAEVKMQGFGRHAFSSFFFFSLPSAPACGKAHTPGAEKEEKWISR
jgi:hypothetical protein